MLIKTIEDTLKIQAKIYEIVEEIKKGKSFDFEITEHKEKRSLNANNYSWKIQDEISKKLGIGIDEVHNKMVLDYGVLETFSIIKEAVASATRMFDYFKVLGESEINGKTFVHIRAGIGTHLYNTKEMSIFINGVVQEAQQLGIETKTPNEINEMLSLWEQYETKNK